MNPDDWQAIDIPIEGETTTFSLYIAGRREEGFVIRTAGQLHAYHNRCPHTGTMLDWVPGRFFSEDGKALLCQTHGALFAPVGGACLSGPCPTGLTKLPLRDVENKLLVPLRLNFNLLDSNSLDLNPLDSNQLDSNSFELNPEKGERHA